MTSVFLHGNILSRMSRVFHLKLNCPPWGPDSYLEAMDAALVKHGSQPIVLPWHTYEMEDDGQHFTDAGFDEFRWGLVKALMGVDLDLILSDSTIDHNNYNRGGEWTGIANERIETAFPGCTVDAVCGSGFVAGAPENQHFHARLSRHMRTRPDPPRAILFVGGWNDISHSTTLTTGCIASCISHKRFRNKAHNLAPEIP